MKTPLQIEHEQNVARVRGQIEALTKRVPRTVIDGGAVMAASYKTAAVSALKVLGNKGSSLPKLREALGKLEVAAGVSASNLQG